MLWRGCSGGGALVGRGCSGGGALAGVTLKALPQDLAGPVVKMRFFSIEKRWFRVTLRFTGKAPYGEGRLRGRPLTGKAPYGEGPLRGRPLTGKAPYGKAPYGEGPSRGRHLTGKAPYGEGPYMEGVLWRGSL